MKVADRVARKVQDSGVTLIWLCETTGIPRTTMHRRLTGKSAFNLNELDQIATALRISPTELLTAGQDAA